MIKHLKPGQLCTINNVVYRAKKKPSVIVACKGCDLNDWFRCPNVVDVRSHKRYVACAEDNIVFQKVS